MQNVELEMDEIAAKDEKNAKTPRFHGGNIVAAARQYDVAEKKLLDFSSNVNPLGPSSAAHRAAKKSLAIIDRYPDPDATELRQAIARYFGIKQEQVICGSGSNSLIHLIPRVFKPRRVLIPVPTFSEYAAAVEAAGGVVVPLVLKESQEFRLDAVDMAFALKGVDMAFLCNPNNPTGLIIHKTDMIEIMEYARQNNVLLVLDEAYMDFIDADSILKEAVQTSHVICIRAFTKFFGMPGLRIGYAVSGETTISALRDAQEPWSVSIPAERAAVAALNDWGHIRKTRQLIEKERDRLLAMLRFLPGIEPFPPVANFIFIKLTSLDAPTLTEKLGVRGILIRDCSSFSGLGNRYVRVAVRTRRENKRLVKALREILQP